jgi:secretion/DNA translocation related TadE-like protein
MTEPERGSGTVLMVVVMTLAGFLITVTLVLASAIVARHRAGAVADLSALAAASGPPGPQACARARRVATANAGRLLRCRILGDGSVLVDVELAGGSGSRGSGGRGGGGPGGLSGVAGALIGTARGSARAGQAPPP